MKLLCSLLLVALTCTTASAADVFKHKKSGLQFQLPKGWTCTEQDEKIFIANKDKSLNCVGGVIPKDSAKAIFADIHKFIDSLDGWDDVKVTDGPQKEKVHGLEQAWYEGTASFKNDKGKKEKVQWDMTVISGGKAILFLIGTGALDDNEERYEEFFESIRKTKSNDD
jgi:predicted Zn-dependent protease